MHPFTFSFARFTSAWQLRVWPWFLVALLLPTLLAPSDPPMITFYNQILSVVGWGACVWAMGRASAGQMAHRGHIVHTGQPVRSVGLAGLSVALLVCMAAAGVSMAWRGLAEGLALMAIGSMGGALVLLHAMFRTSQERGASTVMDLLARALVLTVAVAVLLSFIQVFLPSLPDGRLLAIPTMAGRAVANLRQPNHLATMLVLGSMAAVWVARRGQWSVLATATLVAMAMGAVVMTASRTGMVGSALLLVWALRDRRMPGVLRLAAGSAPLWYAAWWAFMYWWSHSAEGHAFAAAARLGDGSDISSSRFAIWANVLQLVAQHPWLGVGWGEFNVAWTFTAFPGRPTAFFDHTHNIVLQWAVELGLPLAAVVVVGVGLAFWALWQRWALPPEGDAEEAERHSLVCLCGALVAMAGLHSLLEYPLWYAYFLLPTAAAWGVGLAAAAGAPLQEAQAPSGVGTDAPMPGQSPTSAGWDWRAAAGAAMAAGAGACWITSGP
jgi:O-antigen ligase